METKIISGKELSAKLRLWIKAKTHSLLEKGIVPGLAVVLVGQDPASQSYVKGKEKACIEAGMKAQDHRLPSDVSQNTLLSLIQDLNQDSSIHGILVQLPLPSHIEEQKIIEEIAPEKDVDGFHPISIGHMVLGRDAFWPCTPHGILKMLQFAQVPVEGARIVIIGRSNIVGKPMALLLMQNQKWANATVTVCHSKTKDLKEHCLKADIIIAATGKVNTLKAEMVKEGTVVIDVGVNRIEDPSKKSGFKLVGDVDYPGLLGKASAITPVPGGVGPMTIAMLLYNTLKSAHRWGNLDFIDDFNQS